MTTDPPTAVLDLPASTAVDHFKALAVGESPARYRGSKNFADGMNGTEARPGSRGPAEARRR